MGFVADPLDYLVEPNRDRAINDLKSYFDAWTGSWFERLGDQDHQNQITEKDLLAVTMLGVTVPAGVAIWILDKGKSAISAELGAIEDPNLAIWHKDADLSPDGHAWRLWDLLRSGKWSTSKKRNGMGPTTTSKLMAVKRPHLIPIWDSVIGKELFGVDQIPNDYWNLWQDRLSGERGQNLRDAADDLKAAAGVGEHLSVLRTIDIVTWMPASEAAKSKPTTAEDT